MKKCYLEDDFPKAITLWILFSKFYFPYINKEIKSRKPADYHFNLNE